MDIKEKQIENSIVLSLHGKLIGAEDVNILHLRIKRSIEQNIHQIVIDLKNVNWMGSVGIGVLICCLTTVTNAGGQMKLSRINEKVSQLLKITKLEGVFEVYPTIEGAIQSF